jgi:flavodoxin
LTFCRGHGFPQSIFVSVIEAGATDLTNEKDISSDARLIPRVFAMKSLVVYVSVSHGNTEKVAKAISGVLSADLMEAKTVDPSILSGYELVGFGSGIFYSKFHAGLLKLVKEMPSSQSRAFVFSTSGFGTTDFHIKLKNELEAKGYRIVGDFACKAWDTFAPFKLVGGINKGRPDEKDLESAREFAKGLAV